MEVINDVNNNISNTSLEIPAFTAGLIEVIYAVKAVITEIFANCFIGPILWPAGYIKSFTFYDLNPNKLNEKQASQPAILFLHGDPHNQSGALLLARKLQKAEIAPVFTLNLKYDDVDQTHESILKDKIADISKLYKEQGKDLHLIFIGHSKGAIESSHYTYVRGTDPEVKVDKVIALAGRVKVVPSKWRACHPSIQKRINEVSEGIFVNKPNVPFYSIAGDYDWNAPLEAMMLGKDEAHRHMVRGYSHLGVLYSSEVHDKIIEYIKADLP